MDFLGKDGGYFVKYSVESWVGDVGVESGYLLQIEGVVLSSDLTEDSGAICGRMRAYVLMANEMIDGGSFDRSVWDDNEELDDISKLVYTDGGGWSDCAKETWPDVDSMDVLVIEEIFIEKPHRKMGLGLAIADRAISIFGRGCGMVVISPWPTEVDNRGNEEEARVAHGKIGKYAQRLGFKMVIGTDLWAKSLEHEIERESN